MKNQNQILFMEQFENNLRNELIEKSLEHKDEKLFLQMTSENWKEFLYKEEKEMKKFVLVNDKKIIKELEYGFFVEEERRTFYKKPDLRIYQFDADTENYQGLEQDDYKLAKQLCDLTFIEKQILVNELLLTQDKLEPQFVELLEALAADEDILFNCVFVGEVEGLNGAIFMQNGVVHVNEYQMNLHYFENPVEIMNFYLEEGHSFFLKLDESILIQDLQLQR